MGAKKRRKTRPSGPPKRYPIRLLVLLPDGMLEAINGALGKGERRLDFIRTAIAAELERRERR